MSSPQGAASPESEIGKAPYVSLATFRRSGDAVRTPVWMAPADGAHYVFSAGNAGKVKRLKNSERPFRARVCSSPVLDLSLFLDRWLRTRTAWT